MEIFFLWTLLWKNYEEMSNAASDNNKIQTAFDGTLWKICANNNNPERYTKQNDFSQAIIHPPPPKKKIGKS